MRYNSLMSYQVYTTEAIVCGSFDSNTADKSYLLFTRSAGMVYATARSAREERSRQRYALQDFSHITVSLVQGKSGWRIGSVDTVTNFFSRADNREVRGSVVRLVKYLRRYIQGEESNQVLFDDVLTGLDTISSATANNPAAYEQFLMVRILHILGYVALPAEYVSIFARPLLGVPVHEYESAAIHCGPLIATAQTASHL